MRGFQNHLAEFERRGVRIVALSVDPPEASKELADSRGYTFTILSDIKAEIIRRLDLLHESGGMEAPDIARPAEFLLDPDGIIRWVNLTDNWRIRQRPEGILAVIDELQAE